MIGENFSLPKIYQSTVCTCMYVIAFGDVWFCVILVVPKITNVIFCMSTLYWDPPPCDASCTVSVDGQEDIGPVPCSDGNLSVVYDLSTKTVNITTRDQLGQSVVIQTVPAKGTRGCLATEHVNCVVYFVLVTF